MRTLPLSSAPVTVNSLLAPARTVTLYGSGSSLLSLHAATQIACENKPVVYICGDNRFDPYAIARLARQRSCDREATLSRVWVARAFTGYQFDELVRRLNPKDISGPVIISGICSAFLDEDIPMNDAARLFYRALWRLNELARKGMSFLLAESQEITDNRRAYFLNDLFRASNFVVHLDGESSFRLESRSPRSVASFASIATPLLT